ncbi:MAG: DMT family transporter [Myxococcota bacterium]|jgi:drug/metabolite transporter (DMT)-like permease
MWLLLALAGALCTAAADVLTKKAAPDVPEHVVALARWVYTIPVLLFLLPFMKIPALSPGFFLVVLVLIPMEMAALFIYIRAISTSPLSLSAPFLSFTPLFMIIPAAIILDEKIPALGMAGIALVTAGAYAINIRGVSGGLQSPFRAIFHERGPRMVLLVAAIYAVTSTLTKRAVMEAGPYFFALFYMTVLSASLVTVTVLRGESVRPVFSGWRRLAPTGALLGLAAVLLYAALTMAPATYTIAVKRTSMLMGVFAGRIFFNEGGFAQRLSGASLMFAGVVMIALAK